MKHEFQEAETTDSIHLNLFLLLLCLAHRAVLGVWMTQTPTGKLQSSPCATGNLIG